MNKKLLELTPTHYLCPYCGEWHEWQDDRYSIKPKLGFYDNERYMISFDECPKLVRYGNCSREYSVFFEKGKCCYKIEPVCSMAPTLDTHFGMASMTECLDEPIVTFKVPFHPFFKVGSDYCSNCRLRFVCNLVKETNNSHGSEMAQFTLGFKFNQSEYDQIIQASKVTLKGEGAERSNNLQQFLQRDEKSSRPKENNKEVTMTNNKNNNNILNLNVEFGPNQDKNIASTLMGFAVKNGENWRIYDKKKKQITDVGELKLGDLPIYIMPTMELKEGDLIKDGGEYYFVMKATKENTETLSVRTGEMKKVVPIKNMLGFSCYSKVNALTDLVDVGEEFDAEKLAVMSTMFNQSEKGNQMNQLLPLLLFKDKLNGKKDMMKLMLVSSMMNSQAEGSHQKVAMNQLLPLLLLNDKKSGDDDLMKMMIMSSMVMSQNADGNNPFMSYMLLDKFMNNKNEKELEQETHKSNQESNE